MKKQKIYEILITASLSAGIAFLQNLLAHYTGTAMLETTPTFAGVMGGAIHTLRNINS